MLAVITGPPCAGKSTHVEHNARAGDIVIDLDRIALALSAVGARHHEYPKHVRSTAIAARKAAIQSAIGHHKRGARVWLIHSKISPAQRHEYELDGAKILDLDPGEAVCLERSIGQRPAEIIAIIKQWYETPAEATPASRPRARPDAGIIVRTRRRSKSRALNEI